jgi:Tfp pilus assembly protein PilF
MPPAPPSAAEAPDPRARRRFLAALAVLFVLALALRVGAVLESADAPYHRYLALDAATYHRIAVQGDPNAPFWQPPLYPWFLRGVYTIAGTPDPLVPRLVQAFLGAIGCVLLALLGRRFGTPRAGIVAGALGAVLGTAIYFDGELLPASLGSFVVLALVTILTGPEGTRARERLRGLAGGLVLGVGGLLLPTLALPGLFLTIWLAMRRGFGVALLFALAALVPILPVTARNYEKEPDLVPVSWNGGINFWIGNNPDYPETVGIRPGIRWNELINRPRCLGGAATRAAESAWFFGEGLGYATHQPLSWTADMAWKAAATLSAREIGRNRNVYAARDESIVLRALIWPIGFPSAALVACAGLGLLALWRRRELPVVPALVIAGVLFGSVIFFPTARYRAPVAPLLVLVAVVGLPRARGWEWGALPALAALSFVPHGIPPIPPAETYSEIGSNLEQWDRPEDAIPFYQRAIEAEPDNADFHLWLGLAYAKTGDEARSTRHLERAAEIDPGGSPIWMSLGVRRSRAGDDEAAVEAWRRAVETDPCNRRARAFLAHGLMDLGLYNAALEEIEAAERISPRPDRLVREARERWEAFKARRGRPAVGSEAAPGAPR